MGFLPDASIAALRPSVFAPGAGGLSDLDSLIEESFRQDLPAVEALMPEPYYLDRLCSAIFYRLPYLKSLGRDLSNMNVLELGCGRGLKAIPWSRVFRRYWGADLDQESVALGRRLVAATGRDNIELLVGNAVDIMRHPERSGISERIDCVVMYAVLEHLTLDERGFILNAVRDLLSDGGLLILSETPNRLIAHDSHSTFLHFFQSLPTELALRYIDRSPRPDAQTIASGTGDRTTALYRFGQGASYHEFELFFARSDGFLPALRADGWSAWPAADEPIRRDEVVLADYFALHGNLAHPAFSRYWLELVFDFGLSHDQTRLPPIIVPPVTQCGLEVVRRPQCWTLDAVLASRDSEISYDLAGMRPRLLQLDLGLSSGGFAIFDGDGRELASFETAMLESARYKRWHTRCVLDLAALPETDRLVVRPMPQSYVAVECLVAQQRPSPAGPRVLPGGH